VGAAGRRDRLRLDKMLLHRSDYDNHWQAFNIAKAVCRFSFGLSKKDETSRLIERMVDRINQTSSTGFFDDAAGGFGGNFNLYGVMASCSSGPRCNCTPIPACANGNCPRCGPTPRNISG